MFSLFRDIRCILRKIKLVYRKLDNLEVLVADLTGRFDAVNDRISDIKDDVTALREKLDSAEFTLPAEAEAALARLETNVGALDEAAGDADGSDQPQPEEPADEEPTEPFARR